MEAMQRRRPSLCIVCSRSLKDIITKKLAAANYFYMLSVPYLMTAACPRMQYIDVIIQAYEANLSVVLDNVKGDYKLSS